MANLLTIAKSIRDTDTLDNNTAGKVGSWMASVIDFIGGSGSVFDQLKALSALISAETENAINTANRNGEWCILAIGYAGYKPAKHQLFYDLSRRARIIYNEYRDQANERRLGAWFVDYLSYIGYEPQKEYVIDGWNMLMTNPNRVDILRLPDTAIGIGEIYAMIFDSAVDGFYGGKLTYDVDNLTYGIEGYGGQSLRNIQGKICKKKDGLYFVSGYTGVTSDIFLTDFKSIRQTGFPTTCSDTAYNGQSIYAVVNNTAVVYNGLWRGDEDGTNWAKLNSMSLFYLRTANGTVFAGYTTNTIIFSSDDGVTWVEKVFTELGSQCYLGAVSYIDGYYYVAISSNTGLCIYRTDLSEWTLIKNLGYSYSTVAAIIKDDRYFHIVGAMFGFSTYTDVITEDWVTFENKDIPFPTTDTPKECVFDGENWLIWGIFGNVMVSHLSLI